MSLTVNAPFLKFYNLCYLMNQSTGCSWGLVTVQEKGLTRSSHGQKMLVIGRRHSFPMSHPAQKRCSVMFINWNPFARSCS